MQESVLAKRKFARMEIRKNAASHPSFHSRESGNLAAFMRRSDVCALRKRTLNACEIPAFAGMEIREKKRGDGAVR